MTQLPPSDDAAAGRQRFRRTLMRVMTMQVIALIALWLMQRHFTN